jgi:hypothetical protein
MESVNKTWDDVAVGSMVRLKKDLYYVNTDKLAEYSLVTKKEIDDATDLAHPEGSVFIFGEGSVLSGESGEIEVSGDFESDVYEVVVVS